MTATPTPLRELAQQIADEIDIYADDDAYAGKLHRMARHWRKQLLAALSARDEAGPTQEWRWVDERGRAMTNWKQGEPPPIGEVSDEKGTMRVEVRIATPPASGETRATIADDELPGMWERADLIGEATDATPPAASGDDKVLIRALIGLANHLRAVPAYHKLRGDADVIDSAIRRLAAVAPAGMDEVVAYFAESGREAYVFHANDGESLDAYTADGFTVTPLVRSTRAQPDSVMPAEVVQQQASLYNPATQVFFRAGLIACREYMARFVQVESPSIAASIRANWWPNLGQDFGPPRKIDWNELTEGEFGTPSFRVKPAGEVSPTLEALPIALGFLELCAALTPPATAGKE